MRQYVILNLLYFNTATIVVYKLMIHSQTKDVRKLKYLKGREKISFYGYTSVFPRTKNSKPKYLPIKRARPWDESPRKTLWNRLPRCRVAAGSRFSSRKFNYSRVSILFSIGQYRFEPQRPNLFFVQFFICFIMNSFWVEGTEKKKKTAIR